MYIICDGARVYWDSGNRRNGRLFARLSKSVSNYLQLALSSLSLFAENRKQKSVRQNDIAPSHKRIINLGCKASMMSQVHRIGHLRSWMGTRKRDMKHTSDGISRGLQFEVEIGCGK